MDNNIYNFENSYYKKYIKYPLSDFLENNKNKKIGLAIGHGNIHDKKMLTNVKNIDAWYLLDINENVYPDFVCDITNKQLTNYFPNNTFDCILFAYIPISTIYDKYFNILNDLRRVIRNNGYIITTEFPVLHFWFLSDKQLIRLSNKIRRYIKSFDDYRIKLHLFLKNFDYMQVYGLNKTVQKYIILRCFCYDYHKQFIKKIEYNCTKKLFRRNGYFIAKKHANYLYWH